MKDLYRINTYMLDLGLVKEYKRDENGNVVRENRKIVYTKRTAEEIEKFKTDFLEKLEFEVEEIGFPEPSMIVETKNVFCIYWLTKQNLENEKQK